MKPDYPEDADFDRRMRRILAEMPTPAQPVANPARRAFLARTGTLAAGAAALGIAGSAAWQYGHTPRLVRLAFAHVAEESQLRGILVPNPALATASLALPPGRHLPGVLQLCKSCVVDSYPAWHFSVFLDSLGYVQILAFRKPIPLTPSSGNWWGSHWRYLTSGPGTPTLLLARSESALDKVRQALA